MISKRKKVAILVFLLGLALLMLLNLYRAPLATRAGLLALNRLGFEKVSFALSAPSFTGVTLGNLSFRRRINESLLLVAEGLTLKLTYHPMRLRELDSVTLTGGVFKLEPVVAQSTERDGGDVIAALQGLPLRELTLNDVTLVTSGGEPLIINGELSKNDARALNCDVSLLKGEHQGAVTASLVGQNLTAHAAYSFRKNEVLSSELGGLIDSKGIELRGPTNIGTSRNSGDITVLHSFLEGVGEIKLSAKELPASELASSINGIGAKGLPVMTPSRGTVSFDVAYGWGGSQASEGMLTVKDIDIAFANLSLTDLDARIPLRLKADGLDVTDATAEIAKVDFGIAITAATAAFSLIEHVVQLRTAKAMAFGGTLSAGPANFGSADSAWALPVQFHGVSLDQLTRIYPQERIAASGNIAGSFLLSGNDNGVSISKGQIAAEGAGGTINYFSPESVDPGQVSAIALGALSDFRYNALKAEVDLLPTGELTLKTQMAGNNPEWQGGRAVEFNINLQQNLHDLLRSLRLTAGKGSELNTAVQEAMSSK